MFLEIDELQPGWTVELKLIGSDGRLEAEFYSPEGELIGNFN